MKRVVFLLMVFATVLATSCNRSSNNNNSQSPFGGDRTGPGGGGGMRQGNFDPAAMVDRQIEEMNETLDLSAEQETQIRAVIEESNENMAKMREEMQDDEGGFEGMREQMQQSREDQNNKIKEILTEEQWENYETMQSERRGMRGQGRPPQN